MKKLMLKVGAIASVAVGVSLMALPTWAAWSVCVDPAASDPDQFHPRTDWGNCGMTEQRTLNSDGTTTYTVTATGGACGASRVPKGKYCSSQGTGIRCTTLPTRTANLSRSDGRCELAYYDINTHQYIPTGETYVEQGGSGPVVSEGCAAGAWYDSSETVQIGDCSDTWVGY